MCRRHPVVVIAFSVCLRLIACDPAVLLWEAVFTHSKALSPARLFEPHPINEPISCPINEPISLGCYNRHSSCLWTNTIQITTKGTKITKSSGVFCNIVAFVLFVVILTPFEHLSFLVRRPAKPAAAQEEYISGAAKLPRTPTKVEVIRRIWYKASE